MALTAAEKFPPLEEAVAATMPAAMVADYNRRRELALAAEKQRVAPATFEQTKSDLADMIAKASGDIPFERTAEGERKARFDAALKGAADEFLKPLDRKLLKNTRAFDAVAGWNGKYPGPLATGATGFSKSRGAFTAIERLFVYENRPFSWFPVKRLLSEFGRYEKKDLLDEFYRMLLHYPVLLVDDLEKINWQFESESAVLFQFYDWVYRAQRPCITTTNKDRAWWRERTGDAFVRRLFDEAHFEVKF